MRLEQKLQTLREYGPTAHLTTLHLAIDEHLGKGGFGNQLAARAMTGASVFVLLGAVVENIGYAAINIFTAIPQFCVARAAQKGTSEKLIDLKNALGSGIDLFARIVCIFDCAMGAISATFGIAAPGTNIKIQENLRNVYSDDLAKQQIPRYKEKLAAKEKEMEACDLALRDLQKSLNDARLITDVQSARFREAGKAADRVTAIKEDLLIRCYPNRVAERQDAQKTLKTYAKKLSTIAAERKAIFALLKADSKIAQQQEKEAKNALDQAKADVGKAGAALNNAREAYDKACQGGADVAVVKSLEDKRCELSRAHVDAQTKETQAQTASNEAAARVKERKNNGVSSLSPGKDY